MQRVDIYIAIDSASTRISKKMYGYVLECEVSGQAKTREGFGTAEGTYHFGELTAMIAALERLKQPCEVHIHSENDFVLSMLERNLRTWAAAGFVTTKGKPVANKELWMIVWKLSQKHLVKTVPGKHPYSEWLKEEMKKGADYV